MCISNRLKQILDVKNMSVKEFSDITGISYRSAMNYLNEGRDPSVEALIKIYDVMGISITWLITGDGVMFNNANSSLTSKELELLSDFNKTNDKGKKIISATAKLISTEITS